MQRSKLNFGTSFEEIISIIPSGLSHSLSNYGMNSANNSNYGMNSANNSNYDLKNEDPIDDVTKSEKKTANSPNLAAEQAFLSAIYNTIAIASFFLIIAIFGLLLSTKLFNFKN